MIEERELQQKRAAIHQGILSHIIDKAHQHASLMIGGGLQCRFRDPSRIRLTRLALQTKMGTNELFFFEQHFRVRQTKELWMVLHDGYRNLGKTIYDYQKS